MGMFDHIQCECPLPLPDNQGELSGRNWRENEFQTKDFDCLMGTYCIREDGTLWQENHVWETNRKGHPRRKSDGWLPLANYTGAVRFHDFIFGNQADYSVEWMAVFVSGKVTELKLQCWEERDNRERLDSEARWEAERAKQNRFLATWFGRNAYPFYAWIVHGCFGLATYRCWQWLGSQCQRVGLWLNRLGNKLAPYGDPIRAEKRRRDWDKWFEDDEDSDTR